MKRWSMGRRLPEKWALVERIFYEALPPSAGLTRVPAALDLDLREGAGQGGLRRLEFLALEGVRFEQILGAFHRDFRRLFVDVLFVDRAVGHDGDAGAGDFGKAFADGETLDVPLLG